MHRLIVLLFIMTGIIATSLLMLGQKVAPPAYKKSSIAPEVLEDIQYVKDQKKERALRVFFSEPGGFYDAGVDLVLSANGTPVRIFYTLDGSTPTEASTLYISPIRLPAQGVPGCTVVKALAVGEAETSDIMTASYFIGPRARATSESYVFSLSTDPNHLFDYERGILVPGKKYDDYMRNTREPNGSIWRRDANYNAHGVDWERPVYVEMFTADGKRPIAQLAGIRVHGEASRGLAQKSLRLMARKRYEAKAGTFKYLFFEDLHRLDAEESPVKGLDAMVLSNSGSVNASGQLVDPTVIRLARQAGYGFSSPFHSAAVYINGDYYGHAWLTARPNEKHYKKLFDAPDDNFEILEGGEHKVYSVNPVTRYTFWRLHQLAARGLQGEEAFQEFNAKIDVHNLLFYMALEIYVGNSDWPRSNVRIWRYNGSHYRHQHPALDGRWRYILFDTQQSMNTADPSARGHYSYPYVQYSRDNIPFLDALLQRPELAAEFANNLCDFAFVHYKKEKVLDTSTRLIAEAGAQMEFTWNNADRLSKTDIKAVNTLHQQQQSLVLYAEKRPEYVVAELRKMFGYTALFHVVLQGPGVINTSADGEGWYFVENAVPITPRLPRRHVFDYWLVNGKKRLEQQLVVTARDAINGTVNIRLVSHEVQPSLYVTAPYDHGDICGFALKNATTVPHCTHGLYLTDNIAEPKKFAVPAITIAPHGVIEFVGQSYRSTEAMLKMKLNFNARQYEAIYLLNEAGDIVDSLVMPPRSVE